METYRNYGFLPPEPDEGAYELGGLISLPKVILQPNRDWSAFLPKYEPQFGDGWDSFGCTVWGSENAIETLEKKLTGVEKNYSERFTYILAGVTQRGADPHKVAECIRSNGLIPDEILPMTKDYEEFLTPNPMTPELKKEGQRWGWQFGHEYVWNGVQTADAQLAKVMEALQYSPLGVSVTAWFAEKDFKTNQTVYVDRDQPNTHWCVLYGVDDYGYKIYDSYDQTHKILSFDHKMRVCKRYSLTRKPIKRYTWWEFLRRLFV